MKTRHSFPQTRPALRSAQTGATLIVGLVLLLVLTVVGVSGMNTATMEITMAANTQFQQDSFQQAEDAIDIALATRAYSTDAPRTVNWLGNPDYDRRAVTTYRMNTPAPGNSFDYEAFHFDIQSVGRGPRNALSQHTQSFYVVGRAL
ncbi:MAG TPA: PilX N-terminal domain-containing pilus assembly protein [Gammaproteobacteria bacterium]|nr:PilX N-terminal domain-containing pilus assembly protein [Gammaproteobacteria bacterium]